MDKEDEGLLDQKYVYLLSRLHFDVIPQPYLNNFFILMN